MRLKATLVCAWIVFCATGSKVLAAPGESSQGNIVFRLGTFDHASSEFAQEQAKDPVKFVVNQSDPAKDWPASQPAAFPKLASEPGSATAPREITFSLDRAPAATYL